MRKDREHYNHQQYIQHLPEAYRSLESDRRHEGKPYSYYGQSREKLERSQGRRGQTPIHESSDRRSRTREGDSGGRSRERRSLA